MGTKDGPADEAGRALVVWSLEVRLIRRLVRSILVIIVMLLVSMALLLPVVMLPIPRILLLSVDVLPIPRILLLRRPSYTLLRRIVVL